MGKENSILERKREKARNTKKEADKATLEYELVKAFNRGVKAQEFKVAKEKASQGEKDMAAFKNKKMRNYKIKSI